MYKIDNKISKTFIMIHACISCTMFFKVAPVLTQVYWMHALTFHLCELHIVSHTEEDSWVPARPWEARQLRFGCFTTESADLQ